MTTPPGNSSWGGHRRSFPTPTRNLIIRRAGGHCQACGQPSDRLEADHIVPHAEGGTDDPPNGQALCPPCHRAKTEVEKQRGKQRWLTARNPKRPTQPHPGKVGGDPPPPGVSGTYG